MTKVNGEVIPPENARPTAGKLPKGKIAVEILSVDHENPNHPPEASENWEVAVEYPDGNVKSHQIAKTATVGNLITAIRNQIKGRHGADAGAIKTTLPAAIEDLAGETLIFSGE